MLGINTILKSLRLTCQPRINKLLPHTRSLIDQFRNKINRINRKTIPIRAIAHSQFEWGIDVALLPVTPHMQVLLSRSLIGQAVDEPGVRVEVENDGLVIRKDSLPLSIGHTVRVVDSGNESEEVDDVYEADL